MTDARRPLWESMDEPGMQKLEETLKDFEQRVGAQRTQYEISAVVLEFAAGTEVADECRLIASQLTHLASRITDVRADVRARIRNLA